MKQIVGFKDGPLAGQMRSFKTDVAGAPLHLDEGVYDITDPRLANGMLFAYYREPAPTRTLSMEAYLGWCASGSLDPDDVHSLLAYERHLAR